MNEEHNYFEDKDWFRALVNTELIPRIIKPGSNQPELKNWTTSEFEGLGASSKRYVACLEWSNAQTGYWNGLELPRKLFMKVPTMSHLKKLNHTLNTTADSSADNWIIETHQTECKFYSLWKHERPPVKLIKCYSSQEIQLGNSDNRPHLIFEDVSQRGKLQNHYEGLNLVQVLQIAEEFGNLHAWSLKNEQWQNQLVHPRKENCNFIAPYFASVARDLKQMFPQYLDPLINPLLANIDSIGCFYYGYEAAEVLGFKKKVLVHGDCMGGNIFFLNDGDKASDKLLALYDWQVAHAGVPGEDFAKLLMTSVDPDVRREHFDEIFRTYYETLCGHFHDLSQIPFNYDQVVKSFKYLMKSGFIWGLLVHGFYVKTEFEANGESEKFHRGMRRIVEGLKDIARVYSDDIWYSFNAF